MRDKAIMDFKIIEHIFNKEDVCRIGIINDDKPYIVPMNFAYKEYSLYLHSAKEGLKIDLLKKKNNVCFEIESNVKTIRSDRPCNFGTIYKSVIGFGKALIIKDFDEKKTALDIIAKKYASLETLGYPQERMDEIEVIRIDIETMSGKQSEI